MVRKRHRYVVIEVEKEDKNWKPLSTTRAGAVMQALNAAIKTLYGVQGIALSKTALHIEFLGPEAELARITMRRSAYKIVTSALQLVQVVDGGRTTVRSLHTAATKCHSILFVEKYLRRQLESQLKSATSEVERNELKLLIGNRTRTPSNVERKSPKGIFQQPKPTRNSSEERQKNLVLLNQLLDQR